MWLVVVLIIVVVALGTLLPDRDFDTLCRKTFAKFGAIAHTGELLGRVDLKYIAEDGGQNGRLARLDGCIALLVGPGLHIHKGKPESAPASRFSTSNFGR